MISVTLGLIREPRTSYQSPGEPEPPLGVIVYESALVQDITTSNNSSFRHVPNVTRLGLNRTTGTCTVADSVEDFVLFGNDGSSGRPAALWTTKGRKSASSTSSAGSKSTGRPTPGAWRGRTTEEDCGSLKVVCGSHPLYRHAPMNDRKNGYERLLYLTEILSIAKVLLLYLTTFYCRYYNLILIVLFCDYSIQLNIIPVFV